MASNAQNEVARRSGARFGGLQLARWGLGTVLLLAGCTPSPLEKAEPAQAVAAKSRPVSRPSSEPPAQPPVHTPPRVPAGPLRFLAIGGGPTPENTEVSLEQDIELVSRALPAPGLVLFAGGSSSQTVRELDPHDKGDPVLTALGDLFSPRMGRRSRYRAPRFAAERATLDNVDARLSAALKETGAPLVVYIAGHGEQGSEPRNNLVALWSGSSLDVAHLVELHERHQRGLRLVATSCFSGGFAELAFAGADARTRRPAVVTRCGLFAGTWDRETSGCDPNPNRREQESYGTSLVHALAGTRKDGTALPAGAADYDRDGQIGLLDAHTWARIEAVSFDVPTTTSERWLREVEAGSAPIDRSLSREDAAVVDALGKALGLGNEARVEQRWAELDRALGEHADSVEELEVVLAKREAEHAAALLERWPVIDDAFHPDFADTFNTERAAIEGVLTRSPEARARVEVQQRLQGLYERMSALAVEEARVFRLRHAYETLHKAAALMQRGGPDAAYYASLLACERAAP